MALIKFYKKAIPLSFSIKKRCCCLFNSLRFNLLRSSAGTHAIRCSSSALNVELQEERGRSPERFQSSSIYGGHRRLLRILYALFGARTRKYQVRTLILKEPFSLSDSGKFELQDENAIIAYTQIQ